MAKKTKKITKKKVSKKGKKFAIKYPTKLLKPVAMFLSAKLKKLEKRKLEVESEDPFKDESRLSDNASPDTDAAEQFGHARTTAIKEQLDRKIIQTKKALTRVRVGKYGICEKCKNMINTDRLMVYPEATVCIKCEAKSEENK